LLQRGVKEAYLYSHFTIARTVVELQPPGQLPPRLYWILYVYCHKAIWTSQGVAFR